MNTQPSLGNIITPKHFVRFYDDDDALIKEITYFIGTGLSAGHGAVFIATKPHALKIEERLATSGCNIAGAREHHQYVALDAEETLSKFMVNGWPDEERFLHTVGSLIVQMEVGHLWIRAFGEMVSLLWAAESYDAALHLEKLWNSVIDRHSCSLFCAYRMKHFNNDAANRRFKDICSQHSQVLLSGKG